MKIIVGDIVTIYDRLDLGKVRVVEIIVNHKVAVLSNGYHRSLEGLFFVERGSLSTLLYL